ncbi:MAG: hypothetical protein ABI045_02680 [Flavobacteriales bacterium]
MNIALPIKVEVLLTYITTIIFRRVYFSFRNGYYFITLICINAFIIISLHAVFAIYIVYREGKNVQIFHCFNPLVFHF